MGSAEFLWKVYKTYAKRAIEGSSRVPFLSDLLRTMIGHLGYLARRYVFTPATRSVTEVDGLKLHLSPSDVDAPEFLLGTYEEGTTRLFKRLIGPGAVLVDVGAHVGYYTLLGARQVGGVGLVYAFEPEPRNFSILLRNIELNGYQNVVAVQKAVSNFTGPATFFMSHKGRTGLHSLYRNRYTSEKTTEIECTTLDDFFESKGWPRIDFVKLDVEGAELASLEGMSQTIHRHRNLKIIVEFFPPTLEAAGVPPQAFLGRLADMGFTSYVIEDSGGLKPLDAESAHAITRGVPMALNLLCEEATL